MVGKVQVVDEALDAHLFRQLDDAILALGPLSLQCGSEEIRVASAAALMDGKSSSCGPTSRVTRSSLRSE